MKTAYKVGGDISTTTTMATTTRQASNGSSNNGTDRVDNGKRHRQKQSIASTTSQNLLQLNSSKTMLAQEEALDCNEEKSPQNHFMTYVCLKQRWILVLSMCTIVILAAILVAMLITNLSNKDDQCFNDFTFQHTSYKLFSTKTTYSVAYNHLNSTNSRSSPYPNLFAQSESLKSINTRLTRESGCKVRQLHYFGRHAARFPSQNKIEELNKLLIDVQYRIDLSKFSPNNNGKPTASAVTAAAGGSQQQQQPPSNKSSSDGSSSTTVCFNPLAPYKQWESFMTTEQDNSIMDSGIVETQTIAKRYKTIFPELFDSSRTKIDIGLTEELRTAETALVFIKQFENSQLDFCQLDQIQTDNFSGRTGANTNECYRKLLEKYHKEKLQFHKKCESLHKEGFRISYGLHLKDSNRTKFIADSVSKKLKLTKDSQLSSEETEALYDVCKYESAFKGSSIWCNLFTENELKFYEYLNDLDDYYKAYGHPNQARSACPVTTELIKAFKIAKETDISSQQQQAEANFYFTHSEVIQKILAASIDLELDPSYSTKNILFHLESGTVPEEREWRTSLFTPFSANLAFTLYDCPSFTTRQPVTGEPATEIDVNERSLKVVASLNERTFKLDGCSSHVCDLESILADSRIETEKRCRMEDICRKEIIVF